MPAGRTYSDVFAEDGLCHLGALTQLTSLAIVEVAGPSASRSARSRARAQRSGVTAPGGSTNGVSSGVGNGGCTGSDGSAGIATGGGGGDVATSWQSMLGEGRGRGAYGAPQPDDRALCMLAHALSKQLRVSVSVCTASVSVVACTASESGLLFELTPMPLPLPLQTH